MQLIDQLATRGGATKSAQDTVQDTAPDMGQDGNALLFQLDLEQVDTLAQPPSAPASVPKLPAARTHFTSAEPAPSDLAPTPLTEAKTKQPVELAMDHAPPKARLDMPLKAAEGPVSNPLMAPASDKIPQTEKPIRLKPQEVLQPSQPAVGQDPVLSRPAPVSPKPPYQMTRPDALPKSQDVVVKPTQAAPTTKPKAAAAIMPARLSPDAMTKPVSQYDHAPQAVPAIAKSSRVLNTDQVVPASPNPGEVKPQLKPPSTTPPSLQLVQQMVQPPKSVEPIADRAQPSVVQTKPTALPDLPIKPRHPHPQPQMSVQKAAPQHHSLPTQARIEPVHHTFSLPHTGLFPHDAAEPQIGLAPAQTSNLPGPSPAVPVAPITPAQTSHAVHQITAQITAEAGAATGRDIEVRLDPEELGRIRITVHPREAGLFIALAVERPETLELLRRNADELMANLQEFDLSGATLDFSQEGESQSDNETHHHDDAPLQLALTQQPPDARPQSDGRLDLRL